MYILSENENSMVSGGAAIPFAWPVITWLGYNGYNHFNTIATSTLIEGSLFGYGYYNELIDAKGTLICIGMSVVTTEIQYQVGGLLNSVSSYLNAEE